MMLLFHGSLTMQAGYPFCLLGIGVMSCKGVPLRQLLVLLWLCKEP